MRSIRLLNMRSIRKLSHAQCHRVVYRHTRGKPSAHCAAANGRMCPLCADCLKTLIFSKSNKGFLNVCFYVPEFWESYSFSILCMR